MHWFRYAFVVVLLSGGLARAQEVDVAAELKKLQGRWIVAHRAFTPSPAIAHMSKVLEDLGRKVEISNDKLSGKDSYLEVYFDPASHPKAVDLTVPGKEKDKLVFHGIYRFDGDVLTISVGTTEDRPTQFSSPKNRILLALKRMYKQ